VYFAIYRDVKMADQWEELESDPGLFTLLVGDFGVHGVRVEEIYDLSRLTSMEDVYGFVFLFKVVGDTTSVRRKRRAVEEDNFVTDPSIVNDMFFALQVIPNSCATHALLSILLNTSRVKLGPVLDDLKMYTKGMDPESKGNAIANYPHLARTHEKHAKPHSLKPVSRGGVVVTATGHDAFHYSSFVPINGHLYELDGLKPAPVDHGVWGQGEQWTSLFVRVVQKRLSQSKDICFNLMAVVRDTIHDLVKRVEQCQLELKKALSSLVKLEVSDGIIDQVTVLIKTSQPIPPEHSALATSLEAVLSARERLEAAKKDLREEQDIRKGYLLDHARRTHDYNPAIQEFIKALAKHGQLPVTILRKRTNQSPS
jgi:ubiquitin carboxyl-terminal hydrolase BAP1